MRGIISASGATRRRVGNAAAIVQRAIAEKRRFPMASGAISFKKTAASPGEKDSTTGVGRDAAAGG